jgi:hypothetical protein
MTPQGKTPKLLNSLENKIYGYWNSEEQKKKSVFSFVLLSFFRNFVRIRSISLNKGSLGN